MIDYDHDASGFTPIDISTSSQPLNDFWDSSYDLGIPEKSHVVGEIPESCRDVTRKRKIASVTTQGITTLAYIS